VTVINSLTVNAGELSQVSVAWSKMWFGAIVSVAWSKMWFGAIVSCIVQLFASKLVGMAKTEFIEIMILISYSPVQWRILLLFHGAIHASATQSINIFCSQFLPLPIWDCTFRFSVCARQLLSSSFRYCGLTNRLLKKSDMNGM